jgi:hypothetical protein
MDYVEAQGTTPKPQRYLVLSATRGEMEQEINKQADKGYKPILMSITGSTIVAVLGAWLERRARAIIPAGRVGHFRGYFVRGRVWKHRNAVRI